MNEHILYDHGEGHTASTSMSDYPSVNTHYRMYDNALLVGSVCLLASFLPGEANAWDEVGLSTEAEVSQDWDLLPTGQDMQSVELQAEGESADSVSERPDREDTSPSKAIRATKHRSGLTWELLAEVFGVSRQTLHSWANGAAPSEANERNIHRMHSAIRLIDRGAPSVTRSVLLSGVNGASPISLLAEGRYEAAIEQAGQGPKDARRTSPRLSEEERALRAPLSPLTLMEVREPKERPTKRKGRAITMKKTRG